jgi:hypothetical protein
MNAGECAGAQYKAGGGGHCYTEIHKIIIMSHENRTQSLKLDPFTNEYQRDYQVAFRAMESYIDS